MLDSWIAKTRLKNIPEKIARKILINRVSANQLTIIGLMIGLFSALFIFFSGLFISYHLIFIAISLILMIFSFFLDTLDGSLARLEGSTIFGGILDIFCDRIAEVSIIISLISTNYSELGWPGIFLLSSIILCITIFLLTGGLVKNEKSSKNQSGDEKVIQYRKGLIERFETFI
ncbi:MAG: CDP-alcohol phosphatidyltransferase family protein, partial [Promethearchaeota archaeon]